MHPRLSRGSLAFPDPDPRASWIHVRPAHRGQETPVVPAAPVAGPRRCECRALGGPGRPGGFVAERSSIAAPRLLNANQMRGRPHLSRQDRGGLRRHRGDYPSPGPSGGSSRYPAPRTVWSSGWQPGALSLRRR